MQNNENGLIGVEGVPSDEKDAYAANYKAHRKGISHDKMIKAYDEWADNYDKDLCPGVYNGPEILARAVSQQYVDEEEKRRVRILDVAAGTGRVGEELHKLGFRRIDALEPSEGMLEILRQRGIYEKEWHDSIGYHQTKIEDGTYDCVVSAGGMGEGHMPIAALDEMIRVLKSGGLMIVVMREEYLSYVNEYVNKLEPHLNELEANKKCKKVSRTVVPNYSFNKNGVVFVYQAL
ncbi:methyltransferase-like protein 27 [Ischnura elegans]|uniref:methyltransferase-like protein 27 n=1 Tax=Ischnura elegans TaxID=197161 RepID=UPI001ED867CC|nr:methyltransferase-like protein 27 [Ischnura elegans]